MQRAARRARAAANTAIYEAIVWQLPTEVKSQLDELLIGGPDHSDNSWTRLKREPKKPTNKEVQGCIEQLAWLNQWVERLPPVHGIPAAKWRQFNWEVRAYDVISLRRLNPHKRYALMVMLFHAQLRRTMDDVVTMVTRKMNGLHTNARQRLDEYHLQRATIVDHLIDQFRHVLSAYNNETSDKDRLAGIGEALTDSPEHLVAECEQHMAYAGDNYFPFMLGAYRAQRAVLLNALTLMKVQSSSNDQSLVQACHVVLQHRHSRQPTLVLPKGLSLSWVSEKWRKLVLGTTDAARPGGEVQRKYFELCVLSQVAIELKTGDLFIEQSEEYSDYRVQLIEWSDYHEQIGAYSTLLELPSDPKLFVAWVKTWISQTASSTDQQFPENDLVDLNDDGLMIHRPKSAKTSAMVKKLDLLLTERLPEQNILDVLTEAEGWLNLHMQFGPLTGFDSKLDEPRKRFIATLFCYGCNLGPVQTARSIKELSRKQVAWLNLHHVTEDRLDTAIEDVINAYNQFRLPKSWGSGKRVSADGTKWNVYEQNLLSEYHIRYGGYGGIGYYHVSDMYIALFSHFIPCGVYEAIYILDGLMKNTSDIQPDTVYGDTHAQSTPVFGLAFLLGIQLMPRIRKLKNLVFYRPVRGVRYTHIDPLFREVINWSLIERHLPDMLRIVLSIKAGKITPSAILRRLGSHSRKNKLYFAFRELGRVVRTEFLLKYIGDLEIRNTIQAATNKSEEFNQFAQWLLFGGKGVIAENARHEQRKIIKYNHLAANLVILHNVNAMTKVLRELRAENYPLKEETVAGLAPYRTHHINRFGDYSLDLGREITSMDSQATFLL